MRIELDGPIAKRNRLLDALAGALVPGERIVRLVDTYRSHGKITLQLPLDPYAHVVGIEPPRVQPGGITELITYVIVRDPSVREVTFEENDEDARVTDVIPPVVRTPDTRGGGLGLDDPDDSGVSPAP